MRNWLYSILLRFTRGGDDMSVIYALLIIKGLKTISQVPTKLQDQVREYLTALELDESGNPLPAEQPAQ